MRLWRERIKISKSIWPYISEFKLRLSILFILKCCLSIPAILTPLLFKLFVDKVIEEKNFMFMQVVAILFICIYLLETMLKTGHRFLDNKMFNDITYKLRNIAWTNCLYMSYGKYKEYEVNELNKRINDDIDMVKFFMIGEVFDYIANLIPLLVAIIIVINIDWRLSIVLCFLLPVSVLLSRRFQTQIGDLHENERRLNSEIDKWIYCSLTSWKEIKANMLENHQSCEYKKLLKRQHENKKKRLCYMLNRNRILDIKNLYIDQFLLFLAGGAVHCFYSSSIGSVLACIQYYNSAIKNLSEIIEINMNMEWVKPSVYRVMDLLSKKAPDFENEKYSINTHKRKVFEIKQLNYAYPNTNQFIFKNFNMEICVGEKILVKGSSGVGKSTLLHLLTDSLEYTHDSIFFYQKDINNIEQFQLFHYVRLIRQDQYFMNVSIKEYLRLARRNSSENEMEEACKKACIMDYISSLPEKFDTTLGENGDKLSGGQKQKLALARLFLIENKIIILDEAFSAIDGKDKLSILLSILERFKNNTVICVTHDLNFENYFDRTIELV